MPTTPMAMQTTRIGDILPTPSTRRTVGWRPGLLASLLAAFFTTLLTCCHWPTASAQSNDAQSNDVQSNDSVAAPASGLNGGLPISGIRRQPRPDKPADNAATTSLAATSLLKRSLHNVVHGPPVNAKIQQRVWAGSREMSGVGSYIQSGGGSGQFRMQINFYDAVSSGTAAQHQQLRQISDGRLAWFESVIGQQRTRSRVDVGLLNESWRYANLSATGGHPQSGFGATSASHLAGQTSHGKISPGLLVGGVCELLDQIGRDYTLVLSRGRVRTTPVWVLRGEFSETARQRLKADGMTGPLPPLFPVAVRVTLLDGSQWTRQPEANVVDGNAAETLSNRGPSPTDPRLDLFPIRIEFCTGDAMRLAIQEKNALDRTVAIHKPSLGRLISVLELKNLRVLPSVPPIS
ncbi:MAG: hypothetical protein AAFN70_16715, partial [Planctomycetota bacterium]